MTLLIFSVTLILLCYDAQVVSTGTSRFDRVWPLSGSDTVDFGQASPFGPTVRVISRKLTYGFVRGLNSPTPKGTPVHAIDDGVVRISGIHSGYSSRLVQLQHTNWDEAPGESFYSNYMQLLNETVEEGRHVNKGDIIGHTFNSSSGFEHLRFEVRVGGRFSIHCCNPWKFLPNRDDDYSTFIADVQLTVDEQTCTANVSVAVPPDQLTFNRIELHIDGSQIRNYDMCEDNRDHTRKEMDNPLFEGNVYISPKRFTSNSYCEEEWARYEFEFRNLTYASGSCGDITAEVFDVFGTRYTQAIRVIRSTRSERIWPLSGSDEVDLPQSSPFGPRQKASEEYRYDYHRGVDIPTPNGTEVYAIDDGIVRLAGDYWPNYVEPVVQVRHTGWAESPDVNVYSTYIHMLNVSVAEKQTVSKGDLLGYSGYSISSKFEHIHFEIRVGGYSTEYCCNPWKYLPNHENDYSQFLADVEMSVDPNNQACEATVSVSVPPDQLTFNRIELHFNGEAIRNFDMCEDNLDHSYKELDNPLLDRNIQISPQKFSSASYGNGDWASYEFQFLDLPLTSGSCNGFSVKVLDVFGQVHTQRVLPTPTTTPTTTRLDRVWPLSGSDTVDLGQTIPYGPRITSSLVYDFHHGVIIPADEGTPIHAIDDGRVRIAGPGESFGYKKTTLVQIEHTHWAESPGTSSYSNYMNVKDVAVTENQRVNKGDIIAYTSHSSSGREQLLFQIREGGLFLRHCCNPWKFLPNRDNDYSTFTAEVELTAQLNSDDESCVAIVRVKVPPDQLTFNRIELHINDALFRRYDMCADRRNHSNGEIDESLFGGNILISPSRFSSTEGASYEFQFLDLPTSSASGGSVSLYAKAFDVFGNFADTTVENCDTDTQAPPDGTTRLDRVWPLSGSDEVDLGQASPYGARFISSRNILKYDFHRGVNIPTPEGTPIHAVANGQVRIAFEHPSYKSKLIQLKHTGWDESPGKTFYSHYVYVKDVTVSVSDHVRTGDIIGYSSHSPSGWEHLHFQIREGGWAQRYSCNPWKYLPNRDNDYSTFMADVELSVTSDEQTCTATVRVEVPPFQLTFNRIELHINNSQTTKIRDYDMCRNNVDYSFTAMDNPLFQDKFNKDNTIHISPERFTSRSYPANENAVYSFDFRNLPSAGGTVMARAVDVFEHSVPTPIASYTC